MQTIPEEFSTYAETLLATQVSFVKITPEGVKNPTLPWQSKFRGQPYLPKGCDYPVDSHGHPLHLLAQINFAEVPHLEPFPRKGLLQFYISDIADDDLWGMNCERPDAPEMQCEDMLLQHGFRVIYFPEVGTDLDQLVLLDLPKPEYLPINQECNLSFELRQEYVPETDILFSKVLRNQLFERDGQHNGTLWHAYCDAINANGAKLGGYAAFCQDDPRVLLPDPLDWLLLFQMDSEDGEGYSILWGDGGVANFFIRRTALERCDFSQVLYNWDCC